MDLCYTPTTQRLSCKIIVLHVHVVCYMYCMYRIAGFEYEVLSTANCQLELLMRNRFYVYLEYEILNFHQHIRV